MVSTRVITTTDTVEAENKLLEAVNRLTSNEATLVRETVTSYYWWEGAVQNEPERRISFDTIEPLTKIIDILGRCASPSFMSTMTHLTLFPEP